MTTLWRTLGLGLLGFTLGGALSIALAVPQAAGEAEAEPDPHAQAVAQPERGSAAAWSAGLPVVSDGRHMWLWVDEADAKDDEQRVTALYHADATERPPDGPVWEYVTKFTGRPMTKGVAADDNSLWLTFDGGKVSVVSLRPAPIEGDWFFRSQAGKTLPAGTTVRASVAAHGKLWVLARVETGQAIADLDRSEGERAAGAKLSVEEAEVISLVLGFPPELVAEGGSPFDEFLEQAGGPDSEPTDTTRETQTLHDEHDAQAHAEVEGGEDADITATETVEPTPLPTAPADRLLVLDRGSWRVVPLPEAWPANRPTRLVAPRTADDPPALVVQGAKSAEGLDLTLYRPTASAQGSAGDRKQAEDTEHDQPLPPRWNATPLTLPATGGVVGMRLQDQLLLVQHQPTSDGFSAHVWAVRGERLTSIGPATLAASTDTPAQGLWTATKLGDAVSLLAGERDTANAVRKRDKKKAEASGPPGPSMTAIDLHGQTTLEPLRMEVETVSPLARTADTMILLGVVIASTVLLLSFWRRDPTVNNLELPPNIVTADLFRRGLAGLIDLTPGLLAATSLYGLPLEELYDRWPGRGVGATWGNMLPGLAAVGIVVGHTLILELATGRSLGKFVMGLRVATLTGDRPKPWQILTRGLLKSFDLIAYLLLILPVISPFRQRLGDMVARTVVVAKAPPEDESQAGDGA